MTRKRSRYLKKQHIRALTKKINKAKENSNKLDNSFSATKAKANNAIKSGVNSIKGILSKGKVQSGNKLDKINDVLNKQVPKQKQMLNNAVTQIAAHNAGIPTQVSKNGNKKAYLKNASNSQKNAYYGLRRKLNKNKGSVFKILDAYQKAYGSSNGKIANSDEVIENIVDYVDAGGTDDSIIDDIFDKVNNL